MTATPAPFLLDTNVYALFFQNPKPMALLNLERKVRSREGLHFFLPEIVSMEIHSVLGKYRRGGANGQHEHCGRQVLAEGVSATCSHTCVYPVRKRMKPKVFRALQKMLKDIEEEQGTIKGRILPLRSTELSFAKTLLQKYSDKYSFGSHDALVAGTAVAANTDGHQLTLVTSDKGLKAMCREEGLPFFDPALNLEVELIEAEASLTPVTVS